MSDNWDRDDYDRDNYDRDNYDRDNYANDSYGRDNYDRDNRDYDPNLAQQAGYAAGAVEGTYDRADQAWDREEQRIGDSFRRDVDAVEDAPADAARWADQKADDAVQDVEDIPSDIGHGIERAAGWIGEKLGGVERVGRDAEEGVEDEYRRGEERVDRWGDDVRDDYRDGRDGVERFGDDVQGSYRQGEDEGRRDGW